MVLEIPRHMKYTADTTPMSRPIRMRSRLLLAALGALVAGCGAAPPVSGRLAPSEVQRVVRSRNRQYQICYEDGLRKNPSLQGKVSVHFIIDRSGSLRDPVVSWSDLPDPAVVSCVVNAYRGLQFPEPVGGIVTVTYPIMFAPGPL